jgi:hypothetical protein
MLGDRGAMFRKHGNRGFDAGNLVGGKGGHLYFS